MPTGGTPRIPSSSHNIDPIRVTFDHDQAVADAGLLLTGTLVRRFGLEAFTDEAVGIGYRPGRKLLSLVHTIVAGGDCIDDVNVLRAGVTSRIVGHDTVAASTVGTWLRQFTFGHVRQLDRVTEAALSRAWAAGSGPGDRPMFIDVDSTVVEVHGHDKQGAAYGYTRVLGYHPLLATRADTGEVLHGRMRKGSKNTARGAQRFVRETIARVRRAGATGKLTLRADSWFWSHKVMDACIAHGVDFSIAVRAEACLPRSKPSTRTTGSTSTTPTVAAPRSPRRSCPATGWSCDAPRSPTTPRCSRCSPTGATTPSSPTGPAIRSSSTSTTVPTPCRNSRSATSKKGRAQPLPRRCLQRQRCLVRRVHARAQPGPLGRTARRPPRTFLGDQDPATSVAGHPRQATRSARTWTLHLPTRWPWRHLFDDALERLRALPAIA